jgi:hypothetical protein
MSCEPPNPVEMSENFPCHLTKNTPIAANSLHVIQSRGDSLNDRFRGIDSFQSIYHRNYCTDFFPLNTK